MTKTRELKVKGLKIYYDEFNLKIIDSYKIKNTEKMKTILEEISKRTNNIIRTRSRESLINEWVSHNILYNFHIMRKHTKDCDFEYEQNSLLSSCYKILRKIYDIKPAKEQKKIATEIEKKEDEYLDYIIEHRKNIEKAYNELMENSFIHQKVDNKILEQLKTRVENHDLSKFEVEEFEPYRKNFYPINQQEKQNNLKDFEKAWEHHWKNNSHHWEYRQDKKTFNKDNDREVLDVLENILDWMAMGYKFNNRPYQYYEKNKEKIILCKEERKYLEDIIYNAVDIDYIGRD